jgi:hypothetical protein
MQFIQPKTQRLLQSQSLIRKVPVNALRFSRLEPSNDASEHEFRRQDIGKKLLMIGAMMLLITFLVWSMG